MRVGKQHIALLGVAMVMAMGQVAFAESPILWNLEVKGGGFTPGIDDEEGLTGEPYKTVYGDSNGFLLMSELGVQVYRGVIGSVALQGGLGFMSKDGKSIDPESGEQPGDQTTIEILPTQFSVAYHLNYLAEEFNIPFVFSAKYGVDYWAWWFLNADGNLARADEAEGSGSTMGTHFSVGVKFLLDWVDPSSAQSFDSDVGVNRSYLMAEFMRADVNDFGSETSMNLGGDTFLFGIAFEM